MKKISFIIFILCFSFLFCACGDYIELTKKEESLLAEYVADRLLNNDSKFESNLVSDERLQILKKPKPTPAPEETLVPEETPSLTPTEPLKDDKNQNNTGNTTTTPKPTPTKEVAESLSGGLSLSALMTSKGGYVESSKDKSVREEVDGKLSKVMTSNRMPVSYMGFAITDEVRLNQSSLLPDATDKKYLIFDITIKNENNLGEKINTSSYSFTLIVNGSKRVRQALALSPENLSYSDKALVPGETLNGKLYFELSDDLVIDKLELEIVNSNKETEKIVLR